LDPHQGPLVVLEIEHDGAVLESTRLDDQVELLVDQPRVAQRDHIDLDLAKRVEEAVPAAAEQALELAVAEVQTGLVAANLEVAETEHGGASFSVAHAARVCAHQSMCEPALWDLPPGG